MTIGRIMEHISDLLRQRKRFIIVIFGGGGRINRVWQVGDLKLK